MGITKTDFMRGIQCPRMLWLDKHKPFLRIVPPEVQARLDAGNEFGDRAMGLFGPYEEMTVYRKGTRIPDKKKMAEKTAEHLKKGTPVICEAAFIYYNHYCAADILRKNETGYDLYEVKNAPELREQFVQDAGFQYYIITRCGLYIQHVSIVLHGPDEEHPFLPVDITSEAKAYSSFVDEHIWKLNRLWKEKEELRTEPGEQCTAPYRCWYYDYCHGNSPEPEQTTFL